MAAPQALRSNFSDLFGTSMLPVLEEIFRSEYNVHAMARDVLFKTVSHDRDIWQYSEMHDLPLFSSVAEGADYAMSKPKAGFNKTLTMSKYGLGFSISEEAVSDGKFNFIADAVRKMGRSARETQEQAAMNIFNNAFNGSVTTPDGQNLCSGSHVTTSGGQSFRNQLSSPADLSTTALATAISDFEKQFKGDTGIINAIRPKFLVVPSELRLYAKELVGSDKKADTADNNMNSFKDEGLIVVSSPRLTSAVGWFLVADPVDTGLRIVERMPLETKAADPSVGWINDSILYKARYREALAAIHPYGFFGTVGV